MLNALILPGARVPVVSFCLTLFLVLVAVPAAAQTSDPVTNAPSVTITRESEAPGAQVARPRIGLALGGGAARGIAHIGVLRWFEEHRIPVDYIAGTSMGGLIGGAYASGLTPDEIEALMKDADWDLMFLADSPFRYKTFRRKEDARAFPGQLDFGLKGGFKLPSGLNAGQQIEMLLDRIAMPYYGFADFDELPTPFRCVATDIRKAEPVVIGNGSFSRALRATMAIPAVFTPVAFDDRLLVDGGALNNVPADVVKAMGATVAIAVNVGASTDEPPPPNTLFGVLTSTLDSMMTSGTRVALKSADLIIVPESQGSDRRRLAPHRRSRRQGIQGGRGQAGGLLKYQVDEATYAEWTRARAARRKADPSSVNGIVVEGVPEVEETDRLKRPARRGIWGKPLDRAEVEDSVLRSPAPTATRSSRITCGRRRRHRAGHPSHAQELWSAVPAAGARPAQHRLECVRAEPAHAPGHVRHAAAELRAAIRRRRRHGAVGRGRAVQAGWDIAACSWRRARISRDSSFNGYQDGNFVAEYRVKRTGAGIDIGYTTGMRIGSPARLRRSPTSGPRRRVGQPSLPEANGSDSVASLRLVFDGQNSPLVPSRGVRLRAAMRYYFDTPDIVEENDDVLRSASDVPQGEVVGIVVQAGGTRQRMFLRRRRRDVVRSRPRNQQVPVWAVRSGSARSTSTRFAGDNYLLGVVGLLHEWFRLPDVLGGNVYLGGWLEQGSAFNAWRDAEYKASLSAGVVDGNAVRAGVPRLQPVVERGGRAVLRLLGALPAIEGAVDSISSRSTCA